MPAPDPFFPKTAAVRAAEHQLGMDLTTSPGKLSDLMSLEDLKKVESWTSLITEDVLNTLRREHNIDLRVEEPEGVESGHNPGPVRDQTIASPDMPSATNLATMTRRAI